MYILRTKKNSIKRYIDGPKTTGIGIYADIEQFDIDMNYRNRDDLRHQGATLAMSSCIINSKIL